ncbi:MAG TPA: DUF892 family protein [Bryobacteraceae bacterium]|nr:DUF892 family protein [Bryobacteraceae bacterium]
MKIETLDDLLFEELRELYDAELRLVEALPGMAGNTASETLRQAFQQHHQQTVEHVRRLERGFRELGKDAGRATANGMKGLIADGERAIESIPLSPLRDASLIGAARCVEHYEIAAYSTAILFATLLGFQKIGDLLEQTLREEQQTDARLTEIAETVVNQEARQLGAHQRG